MFYFCTCRYDKYYPVSSKDTSGISPLKEKIDCSTPHKTKSTASTTNTCLSLHTKTQQKYHTLKSLTPYPEMEDIEVGVKGIQKLLKTLNLHKASGPDTKCLQPKRFYPVTPVRHASRRWPSAVPMGTSTPVAPCDRGRFT